MRPIVITRQLSAADDNGIALAHVYGAAGNLTLDGALVTSGVAQLGQQRHVALASTGNLSGINFTVYGTDDQGNSIHQTIAGPNNDSVETTLNFSTVTRIAFDAVIGTAVMAGTSAVGESPPIPLDYLAPNSRSTISLEFDGVADATVQFTNDNVFSDDPLLFGQTVDEFYSTPFVWNDHPSTSLVAANSNDYGFTDVTMFAVRLKNNSGTGSVTMRIVQQSLH